MHEVPDGCEIGSAFNTSEVSQVPCLATNHCDESANETEVGEVVGVDGGGWVNLQAVVALASILKQAVHGIQHFVGQQEEPLSGSKVMREHSR